MKKSSLNNIDKFSQIPPDVQVQLCKEVALAFRHLCKTVCVKFGHEGEKVIRGTFLSDSDLLRRETSLGEANISKEVSMTLIKLLASWGIKSDSFVK